jgi:hypothetical protein
MDSPSVIHRRLPVVHQGGIPRDQVFQAIAERQDRINDAVKKGHGGIAVSKSDKFVWKDSGRDVLYTGNPQGADLKTGTGYDNAISFTISVQSVDRDGDVVVSKGCHLENYKLNPVVFWGHQSNDIPIAKAVDPKGRLCVFPMEGKIKATAFFDLEDPDASLIHSKYSRGYLSATSVAFVPIEAYKRNEVEKAHRGDTSPDGWTFVQWDMTEFSCVGVPAQAGAVRDIMDKEKSFISPRMVKALRPFAAVAKGRCFSGWCPCPPCEKDLGDKVKVVDGDGNEWVKEGTVTHEEDDGRTEVMGNGKFSGMFPNSFVKPFAEAGKACRKAVRRKAVGDDYADVVHVQQDGARFIVVDREGDMATKRSFESRGVAADWAEGEGYKVKHAKLVRKSWADSYEGQRAFSVLSEAEKRRDWSKLPQSFILDAVRAAGKKIVSDRLLPKNAVSQRVNITNATTFEELRNALEKVKLTDIEAFENRSKSVRKFYVIVNGDKKYWGENGGWKDDVADAMKFQTFGQGKNALKFQDARGGKVVQVKSVRKNAPEGLEGIARLAGRTYEGAYLDKASLAGYKEPSVKMSAAIAYLQECLNARGLTLVPKTGSSIVQSPRGGGQIGNASGWYVRTKSVRKGALGAAFHSVADASRWLANKWEAFEKVRPNTAWALEQALEAMAVLTGAEVLELSEPAIVGGAAAIRGISRYAFGGKEFKVSKNEFYRSGQLIRRKKLVRKVASTVMVNGRLVVAPGTSRSDAQRLLESAEMEAGENGGGHWADLADAARRYLAGQKSINKFYMVRWKDKYLAANGSWVQAHQAASYSTQQQANNALVQSGKYSSGGTVEHYSGRKSAKKGCCGNCKEGKPCCGKKSVRKGESERIVGYMVYFDEAPGGYRWHAVSPHGSANLTDGKTYKSIADCRSVAAQYIARREAPNPRNLGPGGSQYDPHRNAGVSPMGWGSSYERSLAKDAQADCVSRKVPIFMREHPDWDQKHAVAASFGFCNEHKSYAIKGMEKLSDGSRSYLVEIS